MTSIKVRKLDCSLDEKMDSHWLYSNPILTHLVHALSFQFPSGEAVFVKSVKEQMTSITNVSLKNDVRAFVAQELIHSYQHDALNNWVLERFPGSDKILELVASRAQERYLSANKKSWLKNLAATVCLEHMTVIFAMRLLSDDKLIEDLPSPLRNLLVWHAIEEIEHKHVAFEVYKQAGGSYWGLMYMYMLTSLTLTKQTFEVCYKLIQIDPEAKIRFLHVWQFFRLFFSPNRLILSLVGKFFRFFSPSFRPVNRKEDELGKAWSARLEELVQVNYVSKSFA